MSEERRGFAAEFDRMLREANEQLERSPDPPDGARLEFDRTGLTAADIEAAGQRLAAHRASAWLLPVSCCQLTDATGENHCTHPPHRPPHPSLLSRRRRLALRWLRLRERAGKRLGSWLAGEQLLTRSEWEDQREDDY